MVFPKILYYPCGSLGGAFGITLDLVASANDTGMEDRAHHRNPSSHLDPVPTHDGIHSFNQGVLQAD